MIKLEEKLSLDSTDHHNKLKTLIKRTYRESHTAIHRDIQLCSKEETLHGTCIKDLHMITVIKFKKDRALPLQEEDSLDYGTFPNLWPWQIPLVSLQGP